MGAIVSGYGTGAGYGYGDGYGYVSGSGYGDGYGDGYGYGYVSGAGYGDGSGSGYGYGDGYGAGSGYGSDDGYEILVGYNNCIEAWHYIKKDGRRLVMRNGQEVELNEQLYENNIKLCACGFHSSIKESEAKEYAPNGSVLTKVKVWGRVIYGEDKLVSTNREIIEVLDD